MKFMPCLQSHLFLVPITAGNLFPFRADTSGSPSHTDEWEHWVPVGVQMFLNKLRGTWDQVMKDHSHTDSQNTEF